jgi:hypothetical protein
MASEGYAMAYVRFSDRYAGQENEVSILFALFPSRSSLPRMG